MIVDFHTHIFPPQIIKDRQHYIDSDPCFAVLYSDPKAKLITAEELISSMDMSEVDISVVQNIGWTTHELCVETNDYILEAINRYSDRFIGFCSVQPLSLEPAIKEVERCVNGGIKGVGEIRPDIQMLDLGDEEIMKPLVEALIKYKMILLIHTSEPAGHQYPGKGNVSPEVLYPFITSYPDLTVVCAHWGGGLPFYALMPEVEEAMKNVYFDTAASPLLYNPRIYKQVVDLIGEGNILFGSDYPLLEQSRMIKEIRVQGLSHETKTKILGENARRILGII